MHRHTSTTSTRMQKIRNIRAAEQACRGRSQFFGRGVTEKIICPPPRKFVEGARL